MSSRPLLKPQLVITNGDMSDDLVSLPTNINMVSILSYTVVWTGTPAGFFSVQVSNDYIPNPNGINNLPTNAGNWVSLPLSTPVTAVGDSNWAFIDVDTVGAAWVRLSYTAGSGAGVLNATIVGKSA